jgi:hypothetical protein
MFDGWNHALPSSSDAIDLGQRPRPASGDRIVGEVRIGDMALLARHDDVRSLSIRAGRS